MIFMKKICLFNMLNPMKKYLLTLIFALQSTMVFAETDIDKVLRDVNEAGRQAKLEIEDLKNKQKTPEELECLAHGEVIQRTMTLRKMDFSAEELEKRLFKMYYNNHMTIDELKENMILVKSVYGLPQQVIDSEYETKKFLKKGYEKCLSNLYEQ